MITSGIIVFRFLIIFGPPWVKLAVTGEIKSHPPKNHQYFLEIPFNLKIAKHTIRGQIDRIDELEGGTAVIDYKTGSSKNKLNPEDKEQLIIYQIAAEEIFGLKPKELVYFYLNDGTKASFISNDKEKNNLKEKIVQKIGEIKNSDFGPTPGWQCSFCDFKEICEFAQR